MSTAALARRVAVAIDTRDGLAGSATSPAAELRASTVNLAQAHVVQTGLASDAGLTYGQKSAAYAGAVAALTSTPDSGPPGSASCPTRPTPRRSAPSGSGTSRTTPATWPATSREPGPARGGRRRPRGLRRRRRADAVPGQRAAGRPDRAGDPYARARHRRR
jgi:hypothetical protein